MNGLHSADNWTVVLVVPMLKFFEDFLKISILFSLLAILTYFLVSMNNNDKKI